jgi:hydrogenase expression/formation protein HypC
VSIVDDPLRTATVSFSGVTKQVSLALVPEAMVGDYVIVHVGFAISKLDERAAQASLEAFAALEEAVREGRSKLSNQPRANPEG